MKRSILSFFLSFFLFSCVPEDHVLEIEIVNNTTEPVKELSITTAGNKVSFEADNLPPGQKIDHTLNVPKSSADGEYTFRFSRNNGAQESTTGSYLEEGGRYLKKTLIFEVQEQGVNVEQKVFEVE